MNKGSGISSNKWAILGEVTLGFIYNDPESGKWRVMVEPKTVSVSEIINENKYDRVEQAENCLLHLVPHQCRSHVHFTLKL